MLFYDSTILFKNLYNTNDSKLYAQASEISPGKVKRNIYRLEAVFNLLYSTVLINQKNNTNSAF